MKNRPTEILSGPALGLAIYGFETQVGIPPVVAGAVAVICAFGPLVVSQIVDVFRRQ
jgi:hypothetical protein